MDVIAQFEELDNLIRENTKPPVTPKLRSKLSLMREQIEAYQATSDKQDETLATQAQTITKLQEANAALEEKHCKLELKFENGKRCGVTLKSGEFVPYDADTHAVVPNWYNPAWVEFHRIVTQSPRTYKVVGRVPWTEVKEVHNASP
jgi:hypothetical protein